MSEIRYEGKVAVITGAGWFSSTAIVCGKGIHMAGEGGVITPEEMRDTWDRITDMKDGEMLDNLAESFKFIN